MLINGEADAGLKALTTQAPGLFRAAIIDPPYNRRTKFHHYNDSTKRTQWVAERTRQAAMLRELLREDGSLWMHIDDAEVPAARLLLDSVFGSANFVSTIVWQKSVSRDNRVDVATTHEYILCYSKSRNAFRQAANRLEPDAAQLARYKNPDADPRGPWASGDLTAKAGPGRRAAQFYDLVLPSGRIVRPATGTAWRFTRERLDELIEDGRIDFGHGDKMPRLKRYLAEVEPGLVPNTWWTGAEVGTADSAKRHLKSLFPEQTPFETPKPEPLTARVLRIATDPGDWVIDCYAGSGTTPAVAHKMGRHFVAIEREKHTFQDFLEPRLKLVDAGKDSLRLGASQGTNLGRGFTTIRWQ